MKAKRNRSFALVTIVAALAADVLLAPMAKADAFTNVGSMNAARSYHSATLLQNGEVLVVAGTGQSSLLSSAELYDPANGSWTLTSSINGPLSDRTTTLLPNGLVLSAGGSGMAGVTNQTELYNPATGNWQAGNPMIAGRSAHTATLLRDGRVLIAGGATNNGWSAACETYDSISNTWMTTGRLNGLRHSHTATLLPNGKVLVAGGVPPVSLTNFPIILDGTNTAELYDPATGMWTFTGYMAHGRESHTATLLPNGKVLVAGGSTNLLDSPELYDPASGTWSATPSLNIARAHATATLLPNGQVLLAGGYDTNFSVLNSAELYDPVANTWTLTSSLNVARYFHTATVLSSGQVMFAGGVGSDFNQTASAEVYDAGINPTTGTWTNTGGMISASYWHTATLLPSGEVLVAGSVYGVVSAELYDPGTSSWTATSNMATAHGAHTATLLPNGKVLIAGGTDGTNTTSNVELFDPANGNWTSMQPMNNPRSQHTATLLHNGKLLVAGGFDVGVSFINPSANDTAEIFDPAHGTWTAIPSMNTNRGWHTATMLESGKVLLAGGSSTSDPFLPGAITITTEIYDPVIGKWILTMPMTVARYGHSATLLPNGKVLVVGGSPDGNLFLSSAELFDPVSGTWTATSNSMKSPRFGHTATLLSSGKVLVAGGYDGAGNTLSSGEIYDPATDSWTEISHLMSNARYLHTATLLTDGRLLIAGGYDLTNVLAGAELYDSGLGFTNSWRPQITTVGSLVNIGGSMTVTGNGFRGISNASGTNGQGSSTDYPLVQLRSLESGQTRFLLATNWNTNSFVSVPVTNFPPGYAFATVFVNGIFSTSSIVNISVPMPTAPVLTNVQRLGDGSFQFAFTNSPGALFGAWSTTNAAAALTNWTALGAVTEVAPGQFRFTDPQGTGAGWWFYSVRAP